MKKLLSTLGAATMLTAALILAGCSGAASPTASTDTLDTIDAPSLSAKAYAGFTRITWDKVNGASGYKVYRNGVLITSNAIATTSWNDIATTKSNLIDGIEYTYDVVALPGKDYAAFQTTTASSDSARAVYFKSNMSSVSKKAWVPNITDFNAEYEDYFAKFSEEDTVFKTELVTVRGVNYIKVTAPTLPEFDYKVKTFIEGTPETLKDVETIGAFAIEDEKKTEFYRPVTEAGKWNVEVEVAPLSDLYPSKTFAGTAIEVKKLNVTTFPATAAKRIAENKVRITWTAAKVNGTEFAATDYTLFRKYGSSSKAYTKVEGTVGTLAIGDVNGADVITTKTFYIDDTVENDSALRYVLVLTKDDGIASSEITTISNGITTRSASDTSAYFTDDAKTTARITFTPALKTDTAALYTVYRVNADGTYTKLGEVKSDTKSTTNSNTNVITQSTVFTVTDTVPDNTVNTVYKIYRFENGQTSTAPATATLNSSSNSLVASTPIINDIQATANNADKTFNDVWLKFTLGAPTDSFAIYRAKGTTNLLESDFVAVPGAAYAATSVNNREFVVFDSDLPDGTYTYKVVESAAGKISKASSTAVTVNAKETGNTAPNVNWNSTSHQIVITDSYDTSKASETTFTYTYQIIKKTTNSLNNYYIYTDEAPVAVTLVKDGTPSGNVQATKVSVDKAITADTNNQITYQVLVTKTNPTSGAVSYAVSTWVASN